MWNANSTDQTPRVVQAALQEHAEATVGANADVAVLGLV